MKNLLYLLSACILFALIDFGVRRCVSLNEGNNRIDTVTVTDTVTEYVEVTHYLPQPITTDTVLLRDIASVDYTILHDTVIVRLPVTQKVYSDSDYTAYVSGIDPSLDSIRIYHANRLITKTPSSPSSSLQSGGTYHCKEAWASLQTRYSPISASASGTRSGSGDNNLYIYG